MIHDARYERFLGACQDIVRHREKLAKPVIHAQLLARVGEGVPNEALISHIIAEALLRRIDRTLVESANIYLQRFDISQLDLFYLMRRAYPHVPEGHRVANRLLADEMRKHTRVTLMDIGVGKGVQVETLLEDLGRSPGALRAVTVLAIDPSAANLVESTEALRSLAPSLPFALETHTFQHFVERCTPDDFDALARSVRGPLLVNAAYALHHMAGGPEARTDFFRRLAAMGPVLFTLVEPHSNHDTERLPLRFHHCWQHFGTVFDLVDEADLPSSERFVIKEKFFGREIRDIFGTSDAFRCERHEPLDAWLLRLAKTGFEPYPWPSLEVQLPAHCTSRAGDGLVRLGYRELDLIAVFAFRARGGQPS